jgi:hypothetical protein
MKLALVFGIAILIVLAIVIAGDQMVGITPAMPPMTAADRMRQLDIVVGAVGIVVCVNAVFIWLALRHPPRDELLAEYGDDR